MPGQVEILAPGQAGYGGTILRPMSPEYTGRTGICRDAGRFSPQSPPRFQPRQAGETGLKCRVSQNQERNGLLRMGRPTVPKKQAKPSPGKHGGYRPGAGRPIGSSVHQHLTGKGLAALTDHRLMQRHMIEQIRGSEQDPLLVLLEIATDRRKPDPLRVEAAGIACRYVHPTLASAQVHMLHRTVDPAATLQILTERLNRLAPPPPVVEALPDPVRETHPRGRAGAATGRCGARWCR